ncbi:MAG TPA: lipopolysaccharide biosynthesis protein [Flavilitoribacter sp.]|nr:lipopolysaccharide biosynthesis protein [Flavilitoribacter sp.]
MSLTDRSITAFFWVLVDKLGSSGANFLVAIILARLLTPEDFGLLAMIMIFFELSNTFIQSGFSYALIREKEISDIDKSTTFIFNFLTAIFFYIVLFFSAPAIARFFHQDILVQIVRVMGLNLIISSAAIIQHTILTQRIDFKTQAKVRFAAVLISGGIAIVMAYKGFGVWSLVARIGLMELASAIFLWVVNPWKISLRFSRQSFRKLFGFGSKLLAEALIDKFFRHIVQVLIGRFFTTAILGFFTQANNFVNMAANTFQQSIQRVTYPVLAKLQDDRVKLKEAYRQIIVMSSFIIVPIMVMMGVLAKPILLTMVGEKWLDAVPFLQLLCMAGVTYHINSVNIDLLLVLGRVDLSLRLEVIKKAVTLIAIAAGGLTYGVFGLVAGQVISNYIALFINTYYTDKYLNYPLGAQIRDVLPSLAFSAAMGVIVVLMQNYITAEDLTYLLGGTAFGVLFYLGGHFLAHTEEMRLLRVVFIPKAMRIVRGERG